MFAYFSDKALILLFVGLIVLGPALIAVIGVALAITGHKERALNKTGEECLKEKTLKK